MEISVKGKNRNVDDALRPHIETQLKGAVTKHFNHAKNWTTSDMLPVQKY